MPKRGLRPIAHTKLFPPRLPESPVALDRLLPRAREILNHRLTLLRAPSGFGKSTLCSTWFRSLENSGHYTAWVTLDAADNSLRQIASCLVAAFNRLTSIAIQHHLDDLETDNLSSIPYVGASLINAVASADREVIIFLEDMHHITDPRSLQLLSYLVLNCPANSHFVLTCQAQPGLEITRLHASQAMLLIEADELRLTNDEARSLLEEDLPGLSFEQVVILNESMRGWVTGLKIAARGIMHNRDSLLDIGVSYDNNPWLRDYIKENVFGRMHPHVQETLLKCAVVERLNDGLCKALAGDASVAHLVELAEQGLFVQQLDEAGEVFRLHPVFRSFLTAELRRFHPGRFETQNTIAARWYIDQDQLSQAVDHAIAAARCDIIVDRIAQTAIYDVEHCNSSQLLSIISRLPDHAIKESISIRLAYSLALTIGLRPSALHEINELERDLNNEGAGESRFRAYLEAIQCSHSVLHRDNCDSALNFALSFVADHDADMDFPQLAMRNIAAYSLIQEGRYQEADSQLQMCLDGADKGKAPPIIELYSCFASGLSYRRRGLLRQARNSFYHGIKRTGETVGSDSAWVSLNSYMLAEVLLERGDTDEAADIIGDRRLVVEETFQIDAILAAFRTSIALKQITGDWAGTERLLDDLETIGQERGWSRLLAFATVQRLRSGVAATIDLDSILPRTDEAEALSRPRSREARVCAQLLEARWLEAWVAKDLERCFEVTKHGRSYALATGADGELLRFDMLQARNLLQRGDQSEGTSILVDVLKRSATLGFLRMAVETIPPATWRMLYRTSFPNLLDQSTNRFLDRILATGSEGELEQKLSWSKDANIFDLLTPREIDVLIAVAHDESNKAIARQFHLTPETVKWHLKNLFKKLNANSRKEAVQNAINLGLTLPNR